MRTEGADRRITAYFKGSDAFEKYAHIPSFLISGLHAQPCPRFTVVIPTFDRAHLLRAAIDSVFGQKGFEDYEILVVDNQHSHVQINETENLIATYSDPRLVYYRNAENLGMFGNWNRCLELARSPWVVMLHDDDMLTEKFLKTVSDAVKRQPNLALLAVLPSVLDQLEEQPPSAQADVQTGRAVKIRTLVKRLLGIRGQFRRLSIYDFLLWNRCHVFGAVLNRSKAIALGGFEESFYPGADMFFACKAHLWSSVMLLRQELYVYRKLNNASMSVTAAEGAVLSSFLLARYLIERMPCILQPWFTMVNRASVQIRIDDVRSYWNVELDAAKLHDVLDVNRCYAIRLFRSLARATFALIERIAILRDLATESFLNKVR